MVATRGSPASIVDARAQLPSAGRNAISVEGVPLTGAKYSQHPCGLQWRCYTGALLERKSVCQLTAARVLTHQPVPTRISVSAFHTTRRYRGPVSDAIPVPQWPSIAAQQPQLAHTTNRSGSPSLFGDSIRLISAAA